MLAYPKPVIPGQLNVKAGVGMLFAAIALGLVLSQVQPLPPVAQDLQGIPAETLSWQEVPKQKYAWHICYAFLGNMGLINIGGGLVGVPPGSWSAVFADSPVRRNAAAGFLGFGGPDGAGWRRSHGGCGGGDGVVCSPGLGHLPFRASRPKANPIPNLPLTPVGES